MSANPEPRISLLVIDDNAGSLELLSSALKQNDVRILTAQDPVQGLELLDRHHPQVVITDLVMPNMSGLEVLDRIVETNPSTSVILMTAHYSTESAVDAIKRGAADYLNKARQSSRLARTSECAVGRYSAAVTCVSAPVGTPRHLENGGHGREQSRHVGSVF